MELPASTRIKRVASPKMRPTGFTLLAARGASPVDAGVRPEKIQNAFPGGQ
jgi:hypothetical protein